MKQKYYDVIVVGLGAMGSASLYQLATQLSGKGKKVLGIDQLAPPHNMGSTHGGSRITRQAYYEGKEYIPILKYSYDLWRKIEHDSQSRFFEITGGLMMGSRNNSIVDKSEMSAKAYDLPYEIFDHKEINKRYPMFKADENTWALLDKLAGYLEPEAGVKNQLELAVKEGAEVNTGEQVQFWDAENYAKGIRVKTNKGDYIAEKLIVTTGPWAKGMMQELGITLKPERLIQFWMKPTNNAAAFLPEHFPIFLWNVEKNLDIYGFPAKDGVEQGCKVAFYPHEDHEMREFCTAYNIDREVHKKDIELIRKYLSQYVPDLNGECLKTAVCMHTESPDLHPIIDFHPEYRNVCIANGFSGHGFKFSNVAGQILADLTINGKSDFDISLFKADRFSSRLSQK